MGFRGHDYAFESPAAAVAGMVARLDLNHKPRLPEAVTLNAARGRILANSVACDRDSPAFDYAAMDGYAVRAAEVAGAIGKATDGELITLTVIGEVRIGSAPPVLPPSCETGPSGARLAAIRIVTGAAIPQDADAVVRREDVTEHVEGSMVEGGRVTSISIAIHAAAKVHGGGNIRHRGENAHAGDAVAHAGAVLTAPSLGTLAAVGCVRPRVHPRVRVAVITTGDELVPPEALPGSHQIRNSNAAVIRAVLEAHAWIEVVALSDGSIMHAGDDEGVLDTVLRGAIAHAEAVVLTGGVSMGHRDPVRAAVERCGAGIVFHGLPQRPGKPMLGAVVASASGARVPIFGLPGNPVSAMVTCSRIVLQVLAALAGAAMADSRGMLAPRLVPLANPDGKSLDLWWHRLVRINADGQAELIDARGSGDIIAGGRSDGFIELPPTTLAPGSPSAQATPRLVPFYPWPT